MTEFFLRLDWAIPQKHVRALQLLRRDEISPAKGYFLYEGNESELVAVALLLCIKNYMGDSSYPGRVYYAPNTNYPVNVPAELVLVFDESQLRDHVLRTWLEDRYSLDEAHSLVQGSITFSEFFQ